MKYLKTYDEYLFELVDITNKDAAITAAENGERIQIMWGNGHIAVSPSQEEYFKLGLNSIGFNLDFKSKTVMAPFGDDWSDSKKIKQYQSFLGDLIKAKIIDGKWKFKITGGAAKKNFGGVNVDSILKFNSDFDVVIPRAFHGTSDYYIKEINSKGLVPRKYSKVIRNWDIGYTNESDKLVYLTMDIQRAEYYAQTTVNKLKEEGIKSNPIVIEIRNLPTDQVTTDDDFVTNMGKVNLLQFLMTGKKVDPNNYISGIRSSSQFAYNGRIPSKMIYKIHK